MRKSNVDNLYNFTLTCRQCGKDLLENPEKAKVKVIYKTGEDGVRKIVKFIPCCTGACYEAVPMDSGCESGDRDISDFATPFMRETILIGLVNALRRKTAEMSEEAGEDLIRVMLGTLALVSRDITEKEKQTIEAFIAEKEEEYG